MRIILTFILTTKILLSDIHLYADVSGTNYTIRSHNQTYIITEADPWYIAEKDAYYTAGDSIDVNACDANTLSVSGAGIISGALRVGSTSSPTASKLNLADGYNILKDTSDLTITTASQKTVVLDPPIYEDYLCSLKSSKLGSTAPSDTTYAFGIGGGVAYPVLGFKVNDFVWFDVQTSHTMKLNTALDAHVHYVLPNTTSTGNKFKFQLDVAVAAINGTWSVPTGSPYTIEGTVATDDNTKHRILDMADIPASNSTASTIYKCKLTRISAAGDGTEYGSEVYVEYVDCHYQRDTMGSRQETAK